MHMFIGLLLLGALIGLPLHYLHEQLEREGKCIRRETKMVHRSSWVQVMPIGKTTALITHPGSNKLKSVCVEYSE